MNKLEVQKLVASVNNLIVNEEKFSLDIYSMANTNISNDFVKNFGEYSNFKIDAIAYNEIGELKISCYQVDSMDDIMELIMIYHYDFIYARLTVYDQFGSYTGEEEKKKVNKELNEYFLKHNSINEA